MALPSQLRETEKLRGMIGEVEPSQGMTKEQENGLVNGQCSEVEEPTQSVALHSQIQGMSKEQEYRQVTTPSDKISNRDGAHPEQQGEEDCQDRVESVDLPAHLVENLPVWLVKNLPVQLVDCVQDHGQDEGQVRGDHGLDRNEVLVGVKCEIRGVPTTSAESEIFVAIDCGVQGVINTNAESDKRECAECVMCSRTRRLVSGTGHWGLQLGGGGHSVSQKKG